MMRRLALAIALMPVAALAEQPLSVDDFLPPVLPWKGASERLIASPNDVWATPGEIKRLTNSPNYAETVAFAEKMAAASPLLTIETFGTTPQGRAMIAVVARKPGSVPKPVMLVQAGIHPGEIDGKDAGLMLLRDIAFRGKDKLLDKVDLVFVPIFNIDGHERASRYNRPNQRGPEVQGWRTTAQNYNLNREYLKADAPEMRAMIGLIRKYDPALYLDMHVSDGHDQQYDVTIDYPGWFGLSARSPASGRWLDTRLRPAVFAALDRAGHTPGYYVDLVDSRRPGEGVSIAALTPPRFSQGYGDLRAVPTMLVETHSLKPHRQRVLASYVLIEAALRQLGEDGQSVRAAMAVDRTARPASIATVSERPKAPVGTFAWRGIASEIYTSPVSGRVEVRWLGRTKNETVPRFTEVPAKPISLPVAWWVPATTPELIDRLRVHGVAFEIMSAPKTIEVEMTRIVGPRLGAAIEGRVPLGFAGVTRERRQETFPAGSVRVPADQPLGALAAMWLDPESPDGALAWGFLPGMLQRTEYIEGYVIAPMAEAMMAHDPTLRAAFDAKLKDDAKFAADPEARLRWFYERTPYYDDRYLLYPVGRETAATQKTER